MINRAILWYCITKVVSSEVKLASSLSLDIIMGILISLATPTE